MRSILVATFLARCALAQFNVSVSTTPTQAIIRYNPPGGAVCTIQVANMQWGGGVIITSATQSAGSVTVTTAAPYGLLSGQGIYISGTGLWDGWQTIATTPTALTFTFSSATTGTVSAGTVGVLVEAVDPSLFSGSNTDTGLYITAPDGYRQWVIGSRDAPVALDGNRHSRALQNYAQHVFTLNCGVGYIVTQEFTTQNPPFGNGYTDWMPGDPNSPGAVGYPSVDWQNQNQVLIDPRTGYAQRRVTGPSGATGGTNVAFVTALDPQSAWTNVSNQAILSGSTATFTGPCGAGAGHCPAFLRADNLSLHDATGYASTSNSLDWVKFNVTASIGGGCTGDDCKAEFCLTASGTLPCVAVQEKILSSSPSALVIGTGSLMDLWQSNWTPGINAIDASKQSGTVSTDSTGTVITFTSGPSNGGAFNVKWQAGSMITIAGTQYTIASVQSEQQLTITSSAGSNLTGLAYSANNFGVLIWKKTQSANMLSISAVTYSYGTSSAPAWPANTGEINSPVSTTSTGSAGAGGNLAWLGTGLYWVSSDGSTQNYLGECSLPFASPWFYGGSCGGPLPTGGNQGYSNFDPTVANCWYNLVLGRPTGGPTFEAFVQICYAPPYVTQSTNPTNIRYCNGSSITTSCLNFTNFTPGAQYGVDEWLPTFNPDYQSSGLNNFYASVSPVATHSATTTMGSPTITLDSSSGVFTQFIIVGSGIPFNTFVKSVSGTTVTLTQNATASASGVSVSFLQLSYLMPGIGADGSVAIFAEPGQNYPVAYGLFSLGDRTPAGTDASSFQPIASNLSFSPAPNSFCGSHHGYPPTGGWMVSSNSGGFFSVNYTATLTSTALNTTIGAPGGLNTCPANPYGITGNNCTLITIAADPGWNGSTGFGTALQQEQVGGILRFDNEYTRVVSLVTNLQFWIQRGYMNPCATGGCAPAQSHSTTTANVICGGLNTNEAEMTIWDYTDDPYGSNSGGTTIISDTSALNTHNYLTNALSFFSNYTTFPGTVTSHITAPAINQTQTPSFAGQGGYYGGNGVDFHPGPCYSLNGTLSCLDGVVLNGYDPNGSNTNGIASTNLNPFTNVGGYLWKSAATNNTLHRKLLDTFALVGRARPIDVSGPSSTIGTTSADWYKYCIPNVANECVSGSSVGDVYVNAPFVSEPWFYYGGNGSTPFGDYNRIGIGDLGPQINYGRQLIIAADNTGKYFRSLSSGLVPPNLGFVYWNYMSILSMRSVMTISPWLDMVRSDAMLTLIPPIPAFDGIDRTTFEPVTVNLLTPVGMSIATAEIEFGYLENGAQFNCTSRQETCVAVTATIGGTPFYFETTDSYSRLSCATGCTIAIPGISGRMMYWRAKYFDGGRTLVSISATTVQTVDPPNGPALLTSNGVH